MYCNRLIPVHERYRKIHSQLGEILYITGLGLVNHTILVLIHCRPFGPQGGLRSQFLWRTVVTMATHEPVPEPLSKATKFNTSPSIHSSSPPPGRRKLFGRAFYESIGSPKLVLAPMVDQSEFVGIGLHDTTQPPC